MFTPELLCGPTRQYGFVWCGGACVEDVIHGSSDSGVVHCPALVPLVLSLSYSIPDLQSLFAMTCSFPGLQSLFTIPAGFVLAALGMGAMPHQSSGAELTPESVLLVPDVNIEC